MKRVLPLSLGIILILLLGIIFISQNKIKNVSAAAADHIVISEVQIAGGSSSDEFIELYNPTEGVIDLTGWTLNRKTAAADAIEVLVASLSGSIPSHGFYLIASTGFDDATIPDISYSTQNISTNNSIILRDSGNSIIDLLGMGTSASSETATLDNPIDNRSLERKASSTSLEIDMGSGGIDELLGNAEDTDNNSVDFVRHVSPNTSTPQNSTSATEPIDVSPTPTLEPSPTPSPTDSPSVTPTPTDEPSPTPTITTAPSPTSEPSPTQTPSVTPTSEPSPSPTIEPTQAPSATPTLEPSPSVSPTPSLSPTPPTPTPKIIVKGPILTCSVNYKPWKIFNKTFYFPFVTCTRTTIN